MSHLILMRKRGEAVDIIDRTTNRTLATVTVLAVLTGDTVRLGFTAPPQIKIIRDNAVRREEDDDQQNENDDSRGNRA
jgi:carbon storage regulator CsrA